VRAARALCLLAAVPLAACSVRPDGVSETQEADYIAAVASIGCEMKYESDFLPVELQAGLTREQVMALNAHMLSTDRAVKLEEGGMTLRTGGCA
jgi:hypothetical protein